MLAPAQEKVALFVCDDLTGLLLLNRVAPHMKTIGYEPVIFHAGSHHNRKFKVPTPPVVAFFNAALPRDVIVPTLESQPVTAALNHTARQLAQIHGIEYREITDVNDPSFVAEIVGENYRGGVALRFLQVFEKEAIGVFHEKGFLWNLHSGLLPNYKGLLTPFRAIAKGEKSYGLTMHDLTCGIDEGDIIIKGELPLDASKPVLDLYLDMAPLGADMVLRGLTAFKQGEDLPRQAQEQPPAKNYYTNPTTKEFREFVANGIVYADAQTTVERITELFTAEGTAMRTQLRHSLECAVDHAANPQRIPELHETVPEIHPQIA